MMDAAAKRIEDGELKEASEAELRLRLTIGDTYRELAAFDDAKRMLQPAVELARTTYGGDHRDVAESLDKLAMVLYTCGELASAEPLFREALEMNRRLFPGDHPNVAESLNNMASLLQRRGELPAAEQLYREALEMTRRLFPNDHSDVARSLENLASVVRDRGDLRRPSRSRATRWICTAASTPATIRQQPGRSTTWPCCS